MGLRAKPVEIHRTSMYWSGIVQDPKRLHEPNEDDLKTPLLVIALLPASMISTIRLSSIHLGGRTVKIRRFDTPASPDLQ